MSTEGIKLVVQREVAATPEETFAAWTDSDFLTSWWGPPGTRCVGVDLDVRVGGEYRIGNELPDGDVVWITGEYVEVERPHRLVFTWNVSGTDDESLVTVRLDGDDGGTRVVVIHERIASQEVAEDHRAGWNGCLDGLVERLAHP